MNLNKIKSVGGQKEVPDNGNNSFDKRLDSVVNLPNEVKRQSKVRQKRIKERQIEYKLKNIDKKIEIQRNHSFRIPLTLYI